MARVIDIAHGGAAGGIGVRVERLEGQSWVPVTSGATDDGGCLDARGSVPVEGGTVRLVLDVQRFYASLGVAVTQTEVSTALRVRDAEEDHRITVLLAPSGCTLHVEGPVS